MFSVVEPAFSFFSGWGGTKVLNPEPACESARDMLRASKRTCCKVPFVSAIEERSGMSSGLRAQSQMPTILAGAS